MLGINQGFVVLVRIKGFVLSMEKIDVVLEYARNTGLYLLSLIVTTGIVFLVTPFILHTLCFTVFVPSFYSYFHPVYTGYRNQKTPLSRYHHTD